MPLVNYQFIRVAENDPSRCQGTHRDYQCPFKAIGDYIVAEKRWEGSKFCPRHGGNNAAIIEETKSKRMYLVAKWQEQIDYQADHPKIKSLREEIGILRMTLSAKLKAIEDEQTLVMQAGGLCNLIDKINLLVKNCDAIEKTNGQQLDRTKAKQLIESIVTIIGKYVTDSTLLEMISEEMLTSLAEL